MFEPELYWEYTPDDDGHNFAITVENVPAFLKDNLRIVIDLDGREVASDYDPKTQIHGDILTIKTGFRFDDIENHQIGIKVITSRNEIIAHRIVKDKSVVLTIDPPEMPEARLETEYEFILKLSNIPEDKEQIEFVWDMGDGGKNSKGSSVVMPRASTIEATVTHKFEGKDLPDGPVNYLVRVEAKDALTGDRLAEKTVPVTVCGLKITKLVVEDAVFVPDVTGIPEIGKAPNSATWRLAQAGLGAEASRERNETVAEGVVIRQNPTPNTLVPVGSKVRLTVSAPRKEAPPPETEAKKPPSPAIKRKDTIFMGDSLTYEIGGGTLASYKTTPNGYKPEFRGTVKPGETVSLTLAGTSLARREYAQPGKHDGTLRVSLKATGGGASPLVDSVQKKVAPEATETCSMSFTVPEDVRTVTLTGYFYNYGVGEGFTMGLSAEVKITFRVLGGP